MADTGNTSTITFGTSGFTAAYVTIGGTEQTLEALEDSHLGTTAKKTYVPSDLYEPGEFTIEFFYDPDAQPPLGTVEAITQTYPTPTGQSSGATMAGTGFLISRGTPELVNGTLMRGTGTVKWDGKTGPTFTPSS